MKKNNRIGCPAFTKAVRAGAAFLLLATILKAQDIYVGQLGNNTIGEFTTGGVIVNDPLISGLNTPWGVAISGTNLFVANNGGSTIGEFTTGGATVNASLISGLSAPTGIAISGTNLFVVNYNNGIGSIGEYTTSGATVNASLISGVEAPEGIAISGGDLFVANLGNGQVGSGTISEYTTSGATVSTSLITGLNDPIGVAISGNDLFVANSYSGTIGEYTLSGATVNAALITGLDYPAGIAISGGDLFVANELGDTIGEYTLSGKTVNADLTGAYRPAGIAISPVLAPSVSIQPQTQTVTVGNPAVFNTTTNGTPPLSFQWLFSGTNIPCATNSTLTISNAFSVNQGPYAVVVTNLYGSVTSAPAMLTVSPLVLTAPQSSANGQFQFSFNTATGVDYTIQYSTTLTGWISLVTFEGNGGPITIIDPNAAGSSQRFYRIVLTAQ